MQKWGCIVVRELDFEVGTRAFCSWDAFLQISLSINGLQPIRNISASPSSIASRAAIASSRASSRSLKIIGSAWPVFVISILPVFDLR